MQPLLCNQAAVSHQQPITMSGFLKQFVSWELHKSWLTLANRLLAWEKGRQGAHSLVCHSGVGGGQGGCPKPGRRESSLPRQRGVSSAGTITLMHRPVWDERVSQTHCLPAPTHNPSFIKGFIALLHQGDAQRLPTALSPPSSVRGGAWCHHHHRRTSDFRGCQG